MPRSAEGRIAALDGVRGLAILAVVIHHYFHVKLLWMGVDLFFVLSGFLITGILVRSKGKSFWRYIGHFYQRRALRILPPYLLALVVTSLAWKSRIILEHWYFYIGGMNLLMPWNIPHMGNLPLWSLAVEEQFYLVWPIALFFLPRRWFVPLAAAMIVGAPVLRYIFTPRYALEWAIYQLLPYRMDCLAAGALIALLWPSLQKKIAIRSGLRREIAAAGVVAVAIALGAIVWMSAHGITTSLNTRLGNTLIYSCSLVCATYVLLLALLGYFQILFTLRPLIWLGTISYSVYLSHLGFLYYLGSPLHVRHTEIWALALTAVWGTLSWHLMEKPLLRLGRGDARTVATQFRTAAR